MASPRLARADLPHRDSEFGHPLAGQVVHLLHVAVREILGVVGGIGGGLSGMGRGWRSGGGGPSASVGAFGVVPGCPPVAWSFGFDDVILGNRSAEVDDL